MKCLFVRLADSDPDVTNGGAIFDRRVLQALKRLGADIEVEDVPRARAIALPLWRSQVPQSTLDRVRAAKRDGRITLVSHESLFHIAQRAPVDSLIVHNYFTAFTFRGRPLLEQFYRTGTKRYYGKAFRSAMTVFFISHREHRIAHQDFPELARRTDICVPAPYPMPRAPRLDKLIHLSGNDAWYPKRLSMLNEAERSQIRAAGYEISDFDAPVAPAAAVIYDRFEVGFKLKLVQMLNSRDVIASFCDLSEEIDALCPGHPFYRQVNSVTDALDFFSQISKRYAPSEIDAVYEALEARDYLPSWDVFAQRLITLIDRQSFGVQNQ